MADLRTAALLRFLVFHCVRWLKIGSKMMNLLGIGMEQISAQPYNPDRDHRRNIEINIGQVLQQPLCVLLGRNAQARGPLLYAL